MQTNHINSLIKTERIKLTTKVNTLRKKIEQTTEKNENIRVADNLNPDFIRQVIDTNKININKQKIDLENTQTKLLELKEGKFNDELLEQYYKSRDDEKVNITKNNIKKKELKEQNKRPNYRKHKQPCIQQYVYNPKKNINIHGKTNTNTDSDKYVNGFPPFVSQYSAENEYLYYEKQSKYLPNNMVKKLHDMPSNKGYIWNDIYFYGSQPSHIDDPIVLFEKLPNNILRIHEWNNKETLVFEKVGTDRKYLVSKTPRRRPNF